MTTIYGKFYKQPGEVLDYNVDFTEWFAERADTPVSCTVVAETGLTVVGFARTGAVVKVVVSGGQDGARYKVTVTMLTTPNGLVKEADFIVAIKAV